MPVMVQSVRFVRISPPFRIKRGGDFAHPRPKTDQHIPDDVIAADAKPVSNDLGCEMPVSQLPAQLQKMMRIAGMDLVKRLRFCDNLNHAAIVKLDPLPMEQQPRGR